MKFLIDAHLPKIFCHILEQAGQEAIHTTSLSLGNSTPDEILLKISEEKEIIIVSKDSDFYYSHILRGKPKKLVLIKFGNQRLATTRSIFKNAHQEIIKLLDTYDFIEVYFDKVVAVQ